MIDHDQFLPEYSHVRYPTIKFSDDAINDRLGEKINRIFYETAMLNYDEELGQHINAEYACYYDIANADEDYISILYYSTDGAGGSVNNRCYAVTVSLADGSEVSLTDLMSMDEIAQRLADYRGTIHTVHGYSIDVWLESKEEFIEEWKKDERSPLHGWYLYEGRIGFLFGYPGEAMQIFYLSSQASLTISDVCKYQLQRTSQMEYVVEAYKTEKGKKGSPQMPPHHRQMSFLQVFRQKVWISFFLQKQLFFWLRTALHIIIHRAIPNFLSSKSSVFFLQNSFYRLFSYQPLNILCKVSTILFDVIWWYSAIFWTVI